MILTFTIYILTFPWQSSVLVVTFNMLWQMAGQGCRLNKLDCSTQFTGEWILLFVWWCKGDAYGHQPQTSGRFKTASFPFNYSLKCTMAWQFSSTYRPDEW